MKGPDTPAREPGGGGGQRPAAEVVSFEQLAQAPDAELDVELGAALIARDTYDALDVGAVLADLAALGDPLAALAASGPRSVPERVSAVSERFVSLGFRGNKEHYYDPKNSLLPDVLARRVGIPISLSLVWCALARRAGLTARGVAFPGHFLVRVEPLDGAAAPLMVDPFEGGGVLDEAGTVTLLRRALGAGAVLHASLLAPASPRVFLVRMLTNLMSTWARRGEHARAFVAVDRILTLVPDSARMLRERAALALQIGAVELARRDLARVVELEPQAPDIPGIAERLAALASTSTKITLH
jgi:regulator of sirC expression with transglutaminase-like and TPR domain